MQLAHATLKNISKANQEPIPVQFNPTDYGIDRGAYFAELQVPGLSTPLLQFVRGEAQTLSLELFLDGTDQRASTEPANSVETRLAGLRKFVQIDRDLHAPPVCEFRWGTTAFPGVVTSFKEKYSLFSESGTILRARVTLTLKKYQAVEAQLHEINNLSPDRTRVRVLREGETLAAISAEAYGDARLWRVIADANGIDRPRFVAPGTALTVPSL
jgi:nucleoid-associated protein YgaU